MSDFDNFSIPDISPESSSGVEQSAEQREAQREAFQEAQKKLAASQKKEKRAKKRDVSLAQILLFFIQNANTPDKQRLLVTLVTMVKDDIPVEWILAVLSLNYPALQQVIHDLDNEHAMTHYSPADLILEKSMTQRSYTLADFDEHNLPDEVKSDINDWVKVLMTAATLNTENLLGKSMVQQQVSPLHISLASFVLQDYLQKIHITGEFEKIRAFTSYILKGVLGAVARK